jgi:hypothetical protein
VALDGECADLVRQRDELAADISGDAEEQRVMA